MASDLMRLAGINSGYDTEAMIEKMMSSYQSKIDTQNKKLTKLTWQQEAYRDIITKISDFVLYEACRQNKAWQDMGLPPVTVSINLTAVDFYQTDVKESIIKSLDATGLDPQWLDVELTESLALKDIDHAIQQMQEIRDLGVKLSMDDFGTGYSSLSYIQVLPITLLKLDRSFIMYLEEDEISREIVSAVIRIAKTKKI